MHYLKGVHSSWLSVGKMYGECKGNVRPGRKRKYQSTPPAARLQAHQNHRQVRLCVHPIVMLVYSLHLVLPSGALGLILLRENLLARNCGHCLPPLLSPCPPHPSVPSPCLTGGWGPHTPCGRPWALPLLGPLQPSSPQILAGSALPSTSLHVCHAASLRDALTEFCCRFPGASLHLAALSQSRCGGRPPPTHTIPGVGRVLPQWLCVTS